MPGNLKSGRVGFQGALGYEKLLALGIATAAFASLGSLASTTPVQAFGWGCGGSSGAVRYYGRAASIDAASTAGRALGVSVYAAGVRARRR